MRTIRMKSNRPRIANDFYPTPYGLAKTALQRLLSDFPIDDSSDLHILDAGAGNGVWGDALLNLFALDFEKISLEGIDIEDVNDKIHWYFGEAYHEWYQQDFLTFIPPQNYDLIMGNPPYSMMEEFVRKSFEILNPGGYIFFLGRLEFLASQKRYKGLWQEFPPHTVYISARRPSFISTRNNAKTTDAQEYALYLWQKDNPVPSTELKWLYWEYDPEEDF